MIRRLRRRFIGIAALSVLVVACVIFGAFAALNVSSMNRTMDTLTDSLSEGGGRFPDRQPAPAPGAPWAEKGEGHGFITPETPYATRHFTVIFDRDGNVSAVNIDFIASVSEGEAIAYAQRAADGGAGRGWLLHYRYKVTGGDEGRTVIFVDGSMNCAALAQSLTIAAGVLLFAVLIILLLILLLSRRAMQPIAESYEKQKQFVTDANHELKTPLTLILADLDIAEAELGENEWLSDIRAEGQRMAALVEELVALSRMDEERVPRPTEELPFGALVAETVAEFGALAQVRGKRVESEIDTAVTCRGDEALLRRLLGILLDNAVKYCDEGGGIRVSLRGRRAVVLEVENSYAAVDELPLERLFDRFYRADAARTYAGGYGIGLSLARAIARRHGGSLTAYRAAPARIGFRLTLHHA